MRVLTTSESVVFVRSIVTIIISITDPHIADAAPVAARELVAMARPVGMSADVRPLITAVSAVVLAVTVPAGRDTAVCRLAAEIIYGTQHARQHCTSTVQNILSSSSLTRSRQGP